MRSAFLGWAIGGGAALILSGAARALPKPEPMGSRFYLWFYNFSHGLLQNYDKVQRKGRR